MDKSSKEQRGKAKPASRAAKQDHADTHSSWSLRAKATILFVFVTLALKHRLIIGSLQSKEVFAYLAWVLLHLTLLTIGAVLLLTRKEKLRKPAWLLVGIAAAIMLFNPAPTPTNTAFAWGSFIALIQSLGGHAELTTTLLIVLENLIPWGLMLCALAELPRFAKQERMAGMSLIAAFCISVLARPFIGQQVASSQVWQAVSITAAYLAMLALWARAGKRPTTATD
ncbi:hypothetical protein AUJ68_05430 [Candidatus Woesearchaeota archaeon CG1_02_57_44]|nr:MAG: hypothetical protein AUJ68_05430 [Candidatus Woesearchaeota archaeon CG1_02_57_44]